MIEIPTGTTAVRLLRGDAAPTLRTLPDESHHCCVTSPPYFGLRDYGVEGQIGLEETPEEYVSRLVEVLAEVRRVLHDSGTLWLNLGDTFCTVPHGPPGANAHDPKLSARRRGEGSGVGQSNRKPLPGLKHKDLIGIPWRVAFALQSDGWYLRQWCPWVKRNPMPESVKDRPGTACETVFLFAKSERYFYDQEAERVVARQQGRWSGSWGTAKEAEVNGKRKDEGDTEGATITTGHEVFGTVTCGSIRSALSSTIRAVYSASTCRPRHTKVHTSRPSQHDWSNRWFGWARANMGAVRSALLRGRESSRRNANRLGRGRTVRSTERHSTRIARTTNTTGRSSATGIRNDTAR